MGKKRGREAALISEGELTREDRRRLRRASKNSISSSSRQLSNNISHSDVHMEKQLLQDRRVTLDKSSGNNNKKNMREDSSTGNFSKSAAFFSSLQNETQASIGRKRSTSDRESIQPSSSVHGTRVAGTGKITSNLKL